MKFLFSFSFILIFTNLAAAQQYSFLSYFGEFNNASSFHINSSGNIFITDSGTDEVFKIDSTGEVLKYIGGYGWKEGNFDFPADVFATPLNVYVADKNNHRIQRLDKDLNFISELSTRESENDNIKFGYPLSCATSNQGDLYILDSENKRILKFDLFGNFIQNFGSYDWGNFALNNPKKLAISASGNIYVIDGKNIIVFDQFGNGINKYNTGKNLAGINIIFNKMTINTKEEIYTADLNSPDAGLLKAGLINFENKDAFISSLIFNSKLYILTQKKILVFQKSE